MSHFRKLRSVDVSQFTEKKGRFTYLSWAHCVDQLLLADEKATWSFKEPTVYSDDTMMVWVDVSAFEKTMTAYLPVLDFKNAPIKNPNAMQINTAMQRCLAKGISLFGIGLYIFCGEDIPLGSPDEVVQQTFDEQGIEGARALYNKMNEKDRAECLPIIQALIKKAEKNNE
tara:strand:+ start:943 stop:1455 length:513 start_codon:yes stop_codon:yes gene_type:complete